MVLATPLFLILPDVKVVELDTNSYLAWNPLTPDVPELPELPDDPELPVEPDDPELPD